MRNGRVEVPDWYRIPDRGSGPVAIVVDRHGGGTLEIVSAVGERRGFVGHPGTGAVDVVTFPVQAIFFLFFFRT